MKLFALFGVLALAAGAAPAAASPTFRSDGPNAEAYGAAEGYPVGRATAGRTRRTCGWRAWASWWTGCGGSGSSEGRQQGLVEG